MEIEWYDPTLKQPKVSISYYGLTLNHSAVKWMKYPSFIEVGIDMEKNWLILKPVNVATDKTFRLNKTDNYIRINSKDLIKFIQLHTNKSYKKAKQYQIIYDDGIKAYIADLNN